MMPSKPHIVSALSGEDDAEMEKLTGPATEEEAASQEYSHLDEFVAGLSHDELEYVVSCAQKKLDTEGGVESVEDETPADPEESGATKNEQ